MIEAVRGREKDVLHVMPLFSEGFKNRAMVIELVYVQKQDLHFYPLKRQKSML